jgi:hypothetical protein
MRHQKRGKTLKGRKPFNRLRLPPSLDLLNKLVALSNFATNERVTALSKARDAETAAKEAMESVDVVLAAHHTTERVDAAILKEARAILPTERATGALILTRRANKDESAHVLRFRSGIEVLRAALTIQGILHQLKDSLTALPTGATGRLGQPLSPLRTPVESIFSALELGPDGRLHFHSDLFADFLRPELDGLEAWRLASCRGCGSLFLRKKHDQGGCRQDCKKWNAVQMRDYRVKANKKRNEVRTAKAAEEWNKL